MDLLSDYLFPPAPEPAAPLPVAVKNNDSAWKETEPVDYLPPYPGHPEATPISLTLQRRRIIVEMSANGYDLPLTAEGLLPFPVAVILLFIAAHPAAEWERPVELEGRIVQLHRHPEALCAAAFAWGDRAFAGQSPAAIVGLALDLWNYSHEKRPMPQKKTTPSPSLESLPISTASGSTSSAPATAADGPPLPLSL